MRIDFATLAVIGWCLGQATHASATLALPWLALAGAAALARGELREGPPDRVELAVLAFAAIYAFAAAFGMAPARSLALSVPSLAFLLLAFVLRRARRPQLVRDAGRALLALAAMQSLQVLVASRGHDAAASVIAAADSAWLVVPNDIAWCACLWPLWIADAREDRRVALACTVALPLQLVAFVALESRLALATLALASLAAALALGPRAIVIAATTLATAGAALIAAGTALATKPIASLAARLELWSAALAVFRGYPVLGVGPHNFVLAYPGAIDAGALTDPRLTPWPHSLPLEILAETGIIGLVAATALVHCATTFRRAPTDRLGAATAWGVLTGATFLMLVEASLLRSWTWGLAAFLIAVATRDGGARDGSIDGRQR